MDCVFAVLAESSSLQMVLLPTLLGGRRMIEAKHRAATIRSRRNRRCA